MKDKWSWKRMMLLIAWLLIVVILAPNVYAQQSMRFVIEQVDTALFPSTVAYLSVSSSQGSPIIGLSEGDFSVSEDGNLVPDFQIDPVSNFQQPLSFVLLIDTSGSMAGDPLVQAVSAAKGFVEKLNPGDKIALIAFSDQVKMAQELTSEKALIEQALDSLEARSDTTFYDAMARGVELVESDPNRRVVIVISDGEDTISTKTLDDILTKSAITGVPIYPLGFGDVDADELVRIAAETGGIAQIQPDASTLDEMFSNVLDVLREQYLLRFDSQFPADGAEHELFVTLNYQSEVFTDSHTFIAQPGIITITMPDYTDGQTIGGKIKFAPEIESPAPLSRLDIAIDGQPLDSVMSAPFEYEWDASTISEGVHDFVFTAQDSAGNSESFSISLTVKPAVAVSITEPTDGDELSVTTKISAQVDSQSRISTVEFFVDQVLVHSQEGPPYEYDWPVADEITGTHSIKVVGADVVGNLNDDEITVRVRPPIIVSFISPGEMDVLQVDPEISVHVDSQFDVKRVSLLANDNTLETFTNPPYTYKWPLFDVDSGEYVLSVEVEDVDGHVGTASMNVTVDRGAANGGGGGLGIGVAILVVLVLAGILIPIAIHKRRQTDAAQSVAITGKVFLCELQGHAPGQVWPLTKTEITLGRKQDENDIYLKGRRASRRMAVIQAHQGQYLIYSLVPDNPVVVNGNPINQQHILQPGDTIQLGETQLRFEVRP